MFFYRDGALGVLVSILGVLVAVFDVLAGLFLIQSSPFRVPCGKKYAGLKKVRQRRWWRCRLIWAMNNSWYLSATPPTALAPVNVIGPHCLVSLKTISDIVQSLLKIPNTPFQYQVYQPNTNYTNPNAEYSPKIPNIDLRCLLQVNFCRKYTYFSRPQNGVGVQKMTTNTYRWRNEIWLVLANVNLFKI